ncbi:hypothetical protein [Salinispora sp. H7-4]|uniref:hypothetical protein n=1 Tax=Salinispora sp. H7-4 TaxID=2748321 RepID=UPI0015D45573|nr:hypothetical protein [Salinispora sp. H7-4]NYT92355.1 hypothetical protein [Salinispora sp. H7-4]
MKNRYWRGGQVKDVLAERGGAGGDGREAERVLLPGVTTLRDDVASTRKKAEVRLYAALAGAITASRPPNWRTCCGCRRGSAVRSWICGGLARPTQRAGAW